MDGRIKWGTSESQVSFWDPKQGRQTRTDSGMKPVTRGWTNARGAGRGHGWRQATARRARGVRARGMLSSCREGRGWRQATIWGRGEEGITSIPWSTLAYCWQFCDSSFSSRIYLGILTETSHIKIVPLTKAKSSFKNPKTDFGGS
jgi:hypothetical protein